MVGETKTRTSFLTAKQGERMILIAQNCQMLIFFCYLFKPNFILYFMGSMAQEITTEFFAWANYTLHDIFVFNMCRWGVSMPKIIEKSISILSDAGLGMAMFSLGWYFHCPFFLHVLAPVPLSKPRARDPTQQP